MIPYILFAALIFCAIVGMIAFMAGECEGWSRCWTYYKPMIDRCKKYDAERNL